MNQNNRPLVFVLVVVVLVLTVGLLLGASLSNTTVLNPPARQEDCACTATSRANTQVALDITATTEIEYLKHTVMPARLTSIPYEKTLTAVAQTPTPNQPAPVQRRASTSENALFGTLNSLLILGLCVGSPLILAGVIYLIYDFQSVRR